MTSAKPRIGVVGTGWWAAQHHIPSLCAFDGAELVAIADRDPERLAIVAERFDVGRTYLDAEDMFASRSVDGVVIAVPHASHYPLAKAALEADMHVMVEKPMTLTARDAWELVAIADSRSLHLMVGYTYQFTPAAQACRAIVQSGRIGQVLYISGLFASRVESYYRDQLHDYPALGEAPVASPLPGTYSDPAAGGGQGHTQVTHSMGMVLWVTDQCVREVSAFMDNRDLAVDLIDGIVYRTDDGAIGTMGSTGSLRTDQPRQQELRYYGTEGFVLQDLWRWTSEAHFNEGAREQYSPLTEDDVYPSKVPAPAFADLIAGRTTENWAPGAPAARTVELLEAAYRSAQEGRPIRIEELDTGSRTDTQR